MESANIGLSSIARRSRPGHVGVSYPAPLSRHRGHRSAAVAYTARPKAGPGDRSADAHDRVRRDRIDVSGKITLRHGGRLY